MTSVVDPILPVAPIVPDPRDRFFDTAHLNVGLKSRSIRSGAVTLCAQAAKFILQLGSMAILARLLKPADFGLIAMVAAFTGFVALFKDLGLSAATVQRPTISHAQVSTLFWINIFVSLVLTFLGVCLAPAVAWFYGEPRLGWVTIAISSTFIFGGLAAQHLALLQRQMRFGALAMIDIISFLVSIIAALVLARMGCSYWALVAMAATQGFAGMVGVWWAGRWRPGLPRYSSGILPMLKFGGNLTGVSALGYVGSNLDNVLVGRLWGGRILGMYSKAYGLLVLPVNQISGPVGTVTITALCRAVDDPARYRRAYFNAIRPLLLITGALVSVLIVCADVVIRVLLGPGWEGTAQLFRILGYAGLLLPVWNSVGWLFVSQGRTHEQLRFQALDTVIKVVGIILGIPWGVTGVAFGVAVRYYLTIPVLFWMIGRRGPVRSRDLYSMIALPLLVAGGCLIAVWMVRIPLGGASPFVVLAVGCLVGLTTAVSICTALPQGRLAFRSMIDLMSHLRRRPAGFPNG